MNQKSTGALDWLHGIKADYTAMTPGRFVRRRRGVAPQGASADYHYRSEPKFLRLIEDCRDMDRNDAVIGQGIDRATDNIIQRGFRLDVATGDTELDADLTASWQAWTSDPDQFDHAGEMTFKEFERLAFRQMFVDGDCCLLPVADSLTVQMAEAHRLRTPTNTTKNVVHGVLLSESRRRLEYWFTKDDIDPMQPLSRVGDIYQWPVRDADGHRQLFHIWNPKRYTQTRGVSVLAPVFEFAAMYQDCNIAALMKQQLAASIGLIRKMANLNNPPDLGSKRRETLADGSLQTIVNNVGPAIEFRCGLDDELEAFAPNIPGDGFIEHMKMTLTIIGLNLGLPLVMLLMDGSETNFSGWRGAIDQARLQFERTQDHGAAKLHTQLYIWWLRQKIKRDPALQAVISRNNGNSHFDIFGHHWIAPTWPYIQPLQDAQTDGLRLKYRLISPRGICGERGRSFEKVIEETIKDHELAISAAADAAQRLNQKHPEARVDWREIWASPVQDGVTIPTAGAIPNDGTHRTADA